MHHVLCENVAHAAVVQAPARCQLVLRVGPEDVAQQAVVGDHAGTLDLLHLGQGGQLWRKTAVHADDALVDKRADREVLEALREGLPQTDVVAPLALVVEAVDLVDVVRFVVSSQKVEVLRVLHLIRQEQANALDALLSSVNVVATDKSGNHRAPQEQVF